MCHLKKIKSTLVLKPTQEAKFPRFFTLHDPQLDVLFLYHHDWSQNWDDAPDKLLFFLSWWWHVSFCRMLTHFYLDQNMSNGLIYHCRHSLNKTGSILCLAICAIWITFTFHSWCSLVTAILDGWVDALEKQTNQGNTKSIFHPEINISEEVCRVWQQLRNQPQCCLLYCVSCDIHIFLFLFQHLKIDLICFSGQWKYWWSD